MCTPQHSQTYTPLSLEMLFQKIRWDNLKEVEIGLSYNLLSAQQSFKLIENILQHQNEQEYIDFNVRFFPEMNRDDLLVYLFSKRHTENTECNWKTCSRGFGFDLCSCDFNQETEKWIYLFCEHIYSTSNHKSFKDISDSLGDLFCFWGHPRYMEQSLGELCYLEIPEDRLQKFLAEQRIRFHK